LKVHFLLLPQTSTVYFESQLHSTQLLFAYILQVFLESVVTHTKLKKDLYLMPHTPPLIQRVFKQLNPTQCQLKLLSDLH